MAPGPLATPMFVSAEGIDSANTDRLLAICFLDKAQMTKMKLHWMFPCLILLFKHCMDFKKTSSILHWNG